MIVAALAVGAGAGAGDVAKSAVVDAYTGLRDLLRRRLPGHSPTVEILEAEPADPQVWQARLGPHLAAAGLDDDAEVLDAARRLLELADPAGTRAGKYHPQIGDNSIRIGANYGNAAGVMSGPATVTYTGAPPVPPAAPEA
jgi:hypothetical protein